jgi:hypothetical protein
MSTFAQAQPNDINPGPGRKPSKPALEKKGVNGWGKGKPQPAGGVGEVTPIRQGITQARKGPGGIVGSYRKKPEPMQPPPKVDAAAEPIKAIRQQYGSVTKLFTAPVGVVSGGLAMGGDGFAGKLQKKGIDPAGGFSPVVAKAPAATSAWTGGTVAARSSTAASAASHKPAPKPAYKPAPPVKKAQLPAKKVAGKR